jgi:hypothetical protein
MMKRTWLVLVGFIALALGIFVSQVFDRSKTGSGQVLTTKLAGENAGWGMPSLIPPGMCAVSVRVNKVIGNMAILPGTRVDVLVTTSSSSANEELSTTVLANVAVIGTGQQQPKLLPWSPFWFRQRMHKSLPWRASKAGSSWHSSNTRLVVKVIARHAACPRPGFGPGEA